MKRSISTSVEKYFRHDSEKLLKFREPLLSFRENYVISWGHPNSSTFVTKPTDTSK